MVSRSSSDPTRDRLTGLADERTLKVQVADAPAGAPVSVLRIIDFDQVNAAWGRGGGDAVLRAVADRLAGRAPVAARLSGAEFALIGQTAWPPSLLARLAAPVRADGHLLHFAVAVGTVNKLAGERGGVTVDRARAAAAAARAGGALWWGERAVSDDARLAVDLRRALDGDEITLVFQPQVDARTGAVIGLEALSRWDHEALGRIATERLFAAAARSDFSAPLTDHIIARSLEIAREWPAAVTALPLALNVNVRDLARPGFAARLISRAEIAGRARNALTIEITEDAAMDDPPAVLRAMSELHGAGARVVLDDFGTGQSSLAWLAELPADGLKFDRRFTAAAGRSDRAGGVLATIVRLADQLGLTALAEGVETAEEARALTALGCHRQQGFLYAEALSSDGLIMWLESRQPAASAG